MRRHWGLPDALPSRTGSLGGAVAAMDDVRFIKALAAVERYRRRCTGEEKLEGTTSPDGAWMPSAWENREVTEGLDQASPGNPHAYLIACSSLEHCATLEHAVLWDALQVNGWLKETKTLSGAVSADPVRLRLALQHERIAFESDSAVRRLRKPRW